LTSTFILLSRLAAKHYANRKVSATLNRRPRGYKSPDKTMNRRSQSRRWMRLLKPLRRLEARARKANEEEQKNGEHRASLDVVASHVLAVRPPGRAAPKARDNQPVARSSTIQFHWVRPGQRPVAATK
jgi:hypothetical protein